MNRNNPFIRKSLKKAPAKRFFIITNGPATESDYFNYLKAISYDVLDVNTRNRGYGLGDMLADALSTKRDGDYDYVVVVIDVDDYLKSKKNKNNLNNFISDCNNNGIEVFLSNESFEVWLCAHKKELSNKLAKRSMAAKIASELGITTGNDNKHVVKSEITKQSVQHAIKEVARHRKINKNKDVLKYKPSTDVDLLVSKITFL